MWSTACVRTYLRSSTVFADYSNSGLYPKQAYKVPVFPGLLLHVLCHWMDVYHTRGTAHPSSLFSSLLCLLCGLDIAPYTYEYFVCILCTYVRTYMHNTYIYCSLQRVRYNFGRRQKAEREGKSGEVKNWYALGMFHALCSKCSASTFRLLGWLWLQVLLSHTIHSMNPIHHQLPSLCWLFAGCKDEGSCITSQTSGRGWQWRIWRGWELWRLWYSGSLQSCSPSVLVCLWIRTPPLRLTLVMSYMVS